MNPNNVTVKVLYNCVVSPWIQDKLKRNNTMEQRTLVITTMKTGMECDNNHTNSAVYKIYTNNDTKSVLQIRIS